MVKKQHQFFDFVQILLSQTLVLKSKYSTSEEAKMLVAIEFWSAKLGSAKIWQVPWNKGQFQL